MRLIYQLDHDLVVVFFSNASNKANMGLKAMAYLYTITGWDSSIMMESALCH